MVCGEEWDRRTSGIIPIPNSAARLRITGGGADFGIDTTVSAVVFRQMVDSLAVRGFAARVGDAPEGLLAQVDLRALLTRATTITGALQGDAIPQDFIPYLVALYEEGRFPFNKLIKSYPFESINEAFAASAAGVVLKPVVVF